MNSAQPMVIAPRGLVFAVLTTLAGLAVLIGLGAWQLQRKEWKEGLIAALAERTGAPPRPLPARETWPRLRPKEAEFRRVTFSAEFLHAREALIYTTGSALRTDVSGPGYWVMTPARLVDGGIVMVNRGHVPEARRDAATRPEGQVTGVINITGALRWPEAPGMFTPSADPARNLWFARDHLAIAAAKGLGFVAPFYLEQERPAAPGGPQPGRLHPNLPNNHLQYAITWFGLALALASVFTIWAFRRSP